MRIVFGVPTVALVAEVIVAALAAGGFDGDYDVELYGEELERLTYDEILAHTRGAFASLMNAVPAVRN